jgi:hypothetical protein
VLSDSLRLEPLKNRNEIIHVFGNKVGMFTAYVVTIEKDRLITNDKINRTPGINDKILSGFFNSNAQTPWLCRTDSFRFSG